MAAYANVDISYIVGDLEVACNAKSVTVSSEFSELDTTPLCVSDGWTTCIAGLGTSSFNASLMADVVTLGLDDTMWGYLGTAAIPQSLSIGSADGSVTYFMRGIATQYTPIEGAVGELAVSSLSGKSSTGKLVRGVRIHPPSATRTTTGNGAAHLIGALSAAQTMFAALHVLERTGTISVTVKVQSDDNSGFTTPTDRITTFTAATARGYQWGSVAGAVTDTYWRCVYTVTGSGSMRFALSAGIAAT